MPLGDIFRALSFAAQAHRQQRRKGTGDPYVNHLIEVADLLVRLAEIEDVGILTAAILHDVVEDTSATAAEVELAFGARVRALVEALSDDKSLAKEERKRLVVEHMRHAEVDVRLIKLADLCSNVASLPDMWDFERKSQYLLWSEQVVAACAGTNSALEHEYRSRLDRARAKLADPGDHASA